MMPGRTRREILDRTTDILVLEEIHIARIIIHYMTYTLA